MKLKYVYDDNLKNEVIGIYNQLYSKFPIDWDNNKISLDIVEEISMFCISYDSTICYIFDEKIIPFLSKKCENERLLLVRKLLVDGFIDVDYERIHLRGLPYLNRTKSDDGPYITENPNNKKFKTLIKLSADKRIITLLPNNLIVEATNHGGDKYNIFYVPEYLIKYNDMINIPKDIFLVPYDYFDEVAIPKPKHVKLMIMRKSFNKAHVVVLERSDYLIYRHGLNNNISLNAMKQLILNQSSFNPKVHLNKNGIEYEINVFGTTIGEIINKAIEFNSKILDDLYAKGK